MNIDEIYKVLTTRIRQRQLLNFIAIYEEKNIVAAANQVALTHSTLSKSLSEMEDALQCKLFIRLPRGVRPTPQGDLIYRHTKQILNQHRLAAVEMSHLSSPDTGQIIIGCGHVWDSIIAKASASFKNKYPQITLRIHFSGDSDLNKGVLRADFDMTFGRLFKDFNHPSLIHEQVLIDPDCIMVRNGHPALKQETVELKNLMDFPWLLPLPNAMIRRFFDRMFQAQGLPLPDNVIECSSMLTAKSLLQGVEGLIAMPPTYAFQDELKKGTFCKLKVPSPENEIPVGFTWRQDHNLSEPEIAFQKAVREAAGL